MEVLKSKFYICEIRPDRKRLVRPDLGAFATESKAFNFLCRPAPKEQQARPGCILMERKPEFENFTTTKGERILKRPSFFILPSPKPE